MNTRGGGLALELKIVVKVPRERIFRKLRPAEWCADRPGDGRGVGV
jgi:hypothetical protein